MRTLRRRGAVQGRERETAAGEEEMTRTTVTVTDAWRGECFVFRKFYAATLSSGEKQSS